MVETGTTQPVASFKRFCRAVVSLADVSVEPHQQVPRQRRLHQPIDERAIVRDAHRSESCGPVGGDADDDEAPWSAGRPGLREDVSERTLSGKDSAWQTVADTTTGLSPVRDSSAASNDLPWRMRMPSVSK